MMSIHTFCSRWKINYGTCWFVEDVNSRSSFQGISFLLEEKTAGSNVFFLLTSSTWTLFFQESVVLLFRSHQKRVREHTRSRRKALEIFFFLSSIGCIEKKMLREFRFFHSLHPSEIIRCLLHFILYSYKKEEGKGKDVKPMAPLTIVTKKGSMCEFASIWNSHQ